MARQPPITVPENETDDSSLIINKTTYSEQIATSKSIQKQVLYILQADEMWMQVLGPQLNRCVPEQGLS